MSTTAIDTAGTTEGIKGEVERRFSLRDQEEASRAMEDGFVIPLDGLHPNGWYDGQAVVMCKSNSLVVKDETSKKQRYLWRIAWGDAFLSKIRGGKKAILPEGGETLIQMTSLIASIKGWRGEMEDHERNMVNLTEMDAEQVRTFIRRERLPEWKIKADQKGGLPSYDPSVVNVDFIQMLDEASSILDTEVDFLALRRHLSGNGTSGKAFVVMHDGIFDPGELLTLTE